MSGHLGSDKGFLEAAAGLALSKLHKWSPRLVGILTGPRFGETHLRNSWQACANLDQEFLCQHPVAPSRESTRHFLTQDLGF